MRATLETMSSLKRSLALKVLWFVPPWAMSCGTELGRARDMVRYPYRITPHEGRSRLCIEGGSVITPMLFMKFEIRGRGSHDDEYHASQKMQMICIITCSV